MFVHGPQTRASPLASLDPCLVVVALRASVACHVYPHWRHRIPKCPFARVCPQFCALWLMRESLWSGVSVQLGGPFPAQRRPQRSARSLTVRDRVCRGPDPVWPLRQSPATRARIRAIGFARDKISYLLCFFSYALCRPCWYVVDSIIVRWMLDRLLYSL